MRRSGDWLAILKVGGLGLAWPGWKCPPGISPTRKEAEKIAGQSAATSGTDLYEVVEVGTSRAGEGRARAGRGMTAQVVVVCRSMAVRWAVYVVGIVQGR